MSQRERWIVYPLLFMALLLAGFDKIFVAGKTNFDEVVCKQLRAQEIVCAEMRTVSIDGTRDLVRVGTTPEGGGELLVFYHEEKQPNVVLRASPSGGDIRAAAMQCSHVVVTDDGQRMLVEIGTNPWGGIVNARSRDGAWGVALMHGAAVMEEESQATVIPISGMFGIDLQDGQPVLNEESQPWDGQLWGMQFSRPAQIIPRTMPEPPDAEPLADDKSTPDEATGEAANNGGEGSENDAQATQDDASESQPVAEPTGEEPGPADLDPPEENAAAEAEEEKSKAASP